MAYTYSLHWNGATGSKSQDGGVEYEAVWRVITDDPLDQAEKVITQFEADKVAIGDPYLYANDDDSNAIAKSIKPVRDKGTTDTWLVTVRYAPAGAGEFNFEFVTEDLPLRCEDVSMTTIQHQKPVEKAVYRSGFTGTADAKVAAGTSIIPMNSAFTPFNPGLEKDEAGLAIRVVRRLASVNGTTVKEMMNKVNDGAFRIEHCFFVVDVDKYQARIVSGALALRSEDGQKYWELPIAIEIKEDGWRDFVVDRGTHARAIAGDPDGRGGYISNGDPDYSIPGVPRIRELVDTDETPISDPVLFDGDGQPLDVSGGITPVYIEYSKYDEVNFKTMAYLQGLVF